MWYVYNTHKLNNHIINVIIKCKEVIQPQVPLRLPCYDFALLKKTRFEYNKKHYILIQSLFGWRDGRCVQGAGTYSPRDCDTRLLRIPASWERVTVLNPDYD